MNLQIENPWEEQYACVDSPEAIRKRITLRPPVLSGLELAPMETAVNLFDAGLESTYSPTVADIRFIQVLLGSARAHARAHYVDQKMFIKNIYASNQDQAPLTPVMLCGQAGVGKSAVVKSLTRLFEPGNTVDVGPIHGIWDLVPMRVTRVQGTPSLAEIFEGFTNQEDSGTGKRRAQTAKLQKLASRRIYQSGCCLLGFDEFQFVSLSSSANTLVTKILLGLTYLNTPFFFVSNFSLVHRLMSRNSEETQRLLSKIVVLDPDPPSSPEWQDHLDEYQRIAWSVLDFQLKEEDHALWNMTAGLKRNLRQLLTSAYRAARQHGRYKLTFVDIKEAYASLAFSAQRRDVELLIRQAIEGRPSRKDLWCPIASEFSTKSKYREALRGARAVAVTRASTNSALTAAERKTLKKIETNDDPKPSMDQKLGIPKSQRGPSTAASLIEAADLFKNSRKR